MENTGKLYDLTMIETISQDNKDFIHKMIVMFCDITTQDMEKLKSAAAGNDWETVGQLAHKLKSTVGNMGVTVLKEILSELESRNAKDPAKLVEELDSILAIINNQLKHDHPEAFTAS